jgi:hypothetical protein
MLQSFPQTQSPLEIESTPRCVPEMTNVPLLDFDGPVVYINNAEECEKWCQKVVNSAEAHGLDYIVGFDIEWWPTFQVCAHNFFKNFSRQISV